MIRKGSVATFKEIFHHLESEIGAVFANTIPPGHEGKWPVYLFHGVDKNACIIALQTDWVYTDHIYKDYDGNWRHSDRELYYVAYIGNLNDVVFNMMLHFGDVFELGHWINTTKRE